MEALNVILLVFILACAVAVSVTKSLLASVIIFMAQGLAMSVVWILLRAPDLAITEAAVGAGISSILMFVALKKIHAMREAGDREDGETGKTEE